MKALDGFYSVCISVVYCNQNNGNTLPPVWFTGTVAIVGTDLPDEKLIIHQWGPNSDL